MNQNKLFLAAYSYNDETRRGIQEILKKHNGKENGFKYEHFMGNLIYGVWWRAEFAELEDLEKCKQELVNCGYQINENPVSEHKQNE